MEGSLLRLKSFIPRGEKLPFEYGQISMFVYATFQKSPLDIATGTLSQTFLSTRLSTPAIPR